MISIYDSASRDAALAKPLDPELRAHIMRHIDLARRNGLADDQSHIVAIECGDTEEGVENEIGFSPVVDMDGNRFGHDGFVPYWDYLQDRGDHYELIDTIGNSGFAFIILVLKAEGVWPELLDLCREFAT